MVIDMNVSKLETRAWPKVIEKIIEFLDGTTEVTFSNPTDGVTLRSLIT